MTQSPPPLQTLPKQRHMSRPTKIAALILAAGESLRLGEPKQLVTYRGEPLIRHAALTADSSACDTITVALGASFDECLVALGDLPLGTVRVDNWESGMSQSIVSGVSLLQDQPDVSAILILLCDQPLVTSESLNRIIVEYKKTGAPIVASEYNGNLGAPVLFVRSLFPELITLSGDCGARELIRLHHNKVCRVSVPEAAIDIDTAEDLKRLTSR